MTDPEFLARLDADSERKREDIRKLLRKEGRTDLIAEFDQRMRDIDLGVDRARNVWHSISETQRRVVTALASGGRMIRRPDSKVYDGAGTTAGVATLRNLAARGLVAWDGGAFDPEAAVVGTEQATFLIRHGPAKSS